MTHPDNVICIGASAGGLEAIKAFASVLPASFQGSIVIAQHLSPTHRSLLAPLVERACAIPVVEAESGQEIEPGKIYIVPENADATIKGKAVELSPIEKQRGPHPSVDKLFSSLAESWGDKGIGVVLSGTGSDGSSGAAAIDDAGGMVFVQDEDSAKYWGMPKAIVDKALPRAVMPPEMIAHAIVQYLNNGEVPETLDEPAEVDSYGDIADVIEKKLHFGISQYKDPTVMRRLGARMAASNCGSIEEYRNLLVESQEERQKLVDALLISVTTFFRDSNAFSDLTRILAKRINPAAEQTFPMRIWVPGCCTGEEAYSLAILICELSESSGAEIECQIFATDLSDQYIEYARRGLYTADAVVDLDQKYLKKYFEPFAGGYRVKESLRERVVFAKHDILRSTPFMHIDLVSCRNLLIYFKAEAQRAALSTLANALRPGGLLFLGRSETVGDSRDLFTEISRKARVYERTEAGVLLPSMREAGETLRRRRARQAAFHTPIRGVLSAEERLNRFIFEKSNPTFLIEKNDAVLQMAGDVSRVVSIQPGPSPKDIHGLVHPRLSADLRSAILACRREKIQRVSRPIEIKGEQDVSAWRIVVTPAVGDDAPGDLFVTLEQVRESRPAALPGHPDEELLDNLTHESDDLRIQLMETREQLRTVIQELEVSNEELQAANEELMSSNEEFQATNEELEASNEELQATNEELETINDELNSKNREISDLAADMEGIQRSLQGPLFVFNGDGFTKFVNPAAEDFIRVCGAERSPRHVHELAAMVKSKVFTRELENFPDPSGRKRKPRSFTKNGRTYLVLLSEHADGDPGNLSRTVLLQEATELEQKRKKLQELEKRQRALLDGMSAQTALVDSAGIIVQVNHAWNEFAQANGYRGDRFGLGVNYIGLCRAAFGDCADEAGKVADLLEDVLSGSLEGAELQYPCHAPDRERWFKCLIQPVVSRGRREAVVMHIDVTNEVIAKRELEASNRKAQELSDAKSHFLANMSHELRTPLTAVIGFGEVMVNRMFGPLGNERYDGYARDIVKSSRHLLSIINEIIDFTRVEAGHLEEEQSVVEIEDSVEFAVNIVEAAYRHKNLAFSVAVDAMKPKLRGNAKLISQVFINILTNSAKAVDERGRIDISAHVGSDGSLMIRCCDDGPGIDSSVLERVFEPFEQGGRKVNTAQDRGLGLGLSIVKSVIDRHGGTVTAHNVEPHGLCVNITFPADRLVGS